MNLILEIISFPLKAFWWIMKIMFLILLMPIAVLAELLKYYDGSYLHGRRCRRRRRY